MSHINDLLGVVRGLRLVLESGLKIQQENSKLIWNNSSIKALVQNCPTNTLTASKPQPDDAKDLMERALVVAHGLRQYAAMNIPNFSAEPVKVPEMDNAMKEEIDELNREFNKTFETLKKAQDVATTASAPSKVEYVAPLEKIQVKSPVEPVSPAVEHSVKPEVVIPTPQSQSPKVEKASSSGPTAVPKPVAKKKIRVSVSCLYNLIFIIPM